jgi:DNA-binding transcriptional LysR family regulator
MTPLPTPQQLRYLVTLAETGHFGRAASACAVSQSTLSAGILVLERQLHAQILDRSAGKHVVFTSLGNELVAKARLALAALTALAEAADAARAPMTGPLRLGLIPTIGPFLLPRLMPQLRVHYPALRLFLREDQTEHLLDQLSSGQLDVLLLAEPCACLGAETLAVIRDEFLAAVPKDHPLAAACATKCWQPAGRTPPAPRTSLPPRSIPSSKWLPAALASPWCPASPPPPVSPPEPTSHSAAWKAPAAGEPSPSPGAQTPPVPPNTAPSGPSLPLLLQRRRAGSTSFYEQKGGAASGRLMGFAGGFRGP